MEHPDKVMPKRRRARRLALPAALSLLALALLFYFVLLPMIARKYPSKALQQITVEHTERALGASERASVSEITVSHAWDGESYTLVHSGGKLLLKAEGGALLPVSEAMTEDIWVAATNFIVQDTVSESPDEIREHLADMGLEPPQITVDVLLTDGESYRLSYGIKAPETNCYYYRWSGGEGVYMADSGSYETFEATARMLLPVSQPEFSKSLVDEVTLEIAGQEKVALRYQTDEDGNASAAVTLPTPYPAARELSEAVLTAIANLRLGTLQGEITDENSGGYGLDQPRMTLTVHQRAGVYTRVGETGELETLARPESTILLHVGAAAGDYFYYVGYEGSCYYVSRFLLSALLSVTPEKLYTRSPFDMGDAQIESVLIQMGDAAWELRLSRVERVLPNNALETDENGNALYDVSATKNGESVPVEAVEQLIERLKSLTVSGDVARGYTPGADAPRWRVTITTRQGVTRDVAARPMDALTDALTVDGATLHYVSSEAILILIGNL